MKKSIAIVGMILITVSTYAQTSFTVDAYNFSNLSTENQKPVMVMLGSSELNQKLSFVGFSLISERFNQAEIGLGYNFTPSLYGNILVGIENHPDLWRIKSALIYSHGRTFIFSGGEIGASGYWYSSIGTYKIVDRKSDISIGYFLRRFEGLGPRIEWSKGKFNLYAMPFVYDFESKNSGLEVGLKLNL